jgi:protein SCO1/2
MKTSAAISLSGKVLPALLLAGIGIFYGLQPRRSEDHPPIGVVKEVPPFSFQERGGRAVSREDLLGKVWVADFIFTSCSGTCPAMTAQMRRLQELLGEGAREVVLVSFTVDPERDTPGALKAYAEKNGAGSGWLFLRGPEREVAQLSRTGFLLGTGAPGTAAAVDPTLPPGTEPIAHARHFALVDRQGRIRNYYDGTDPERVGQLARDARALLAEGKL